MAEGSFALSLLAMAETFRISAPTLVESLLGDVTRDTCNARLRAWAHRLVTQAGIELDVRGVQHATHGDETFVVMSNHQSHYDIPVLFDTFPGCIRMVAKTELYRIPVFGNALTTAEFIEIDRGNRERARDSLRLAQERLRSGINVWIAPEGTRSPTGRMGSFKKGGFILALETGTRILPVTIDGTRHVLPAKGARVRRGKRVQVTYHAPIDPRVYGMERRESLVADVRAAIASALPAELHGES